MKAMVRIFALVALVAAVTTLAVAGNNEEKPAFNKERAEANLLVGLASDNLGLRESCAFMLGEIGSTKAVLPLMAMLHGEVESSRVVAALALSRIGEPRGVFAVKQAAKFDPSTRVQKLAAWYVNQYASPGTYDFIAQEKPKDADEMAVR